MTSAAEPSASEPPELKRIPQTVWRTLRLSWQATPSGFAVLLGLTVVSAAVPPLLVFISRRLVDLIAQAPVAVQSLLPWAVSMGGLTRVGGVDIREVEPRALRDRFGVLFQDYTNLSLRVREAVGAGRVSTPATDAALWAALEAAQADQIVRKLPRGLDNYVGRSFENGKDLSGGEWQRLALARLMFRDADVWILDEPTSSLDPEAEAAIFARLKQQLHGRIGIVISHRFSTVRIADRIAVMQDGRITELGSHDQLMALEGRYAHLFELQASAYR